MAPIATAIRFRIRPRARVVAAVTLRLLALLVHGGNDAYAPSARLSHSVQQCSEDARGWTARGVTFGDPFTVSVI